MSEQDNQRLRQGHCDKICIDYGLFSCNLAQPLDQDRWASV